MAIGMTYDEYWYGDVRMTGAFIEADKLRQKQKNTEMWLMGLYVYDAISRLAPILNGFAKDPKAKDYPKMPYGEKEKKKDEPSEQEVANERLKSQLFFENWARATSKRMKGGGADGGVRQT